MSIHLLAFNFLLGNKKRSAAMSSAPAGSTAGDRESAELAAHDPHTCVLVRFLLACNNVLPTFENVGRFDFSRFIYFAMYLDIY